MTAPVSIDEPLVRSTMGEAAPPIAVDLDGTLTLTDTLYEGVVGLLTRSPGQAFALAGTLRTGKAAVKRHVADQAGFDPALLPYNETLLTWLRGEHAAGRRIGLFTAADQSIADAVAAHIGLFDVVRGSDGETNLSGATKATAIKAEFGTRFTYAGDGAVDAPIFAEAASVVLVGHVERLRTKTGGTAVEASFPVPNAGIAVWARALRLRHWSKNALVFVAPILSMQSLSLPPVLLMFVLMGVLASATYLLNDLMDLAADRTHPIKRSRPLASGAIKVRDGIAVAGAMIAAALLCGLLLLPHACTVVLVAYLVITLLYSVYFKRLPMIDVTVLAGLFTLRVLAGNTLVRAPLSPWLLTFSMLFFLGLAAIKRYAELLRVGGSRENGGQARGYSQRDIPILLATGVSTGISAIVIFMIYLINEQYPRAIYHHPEALWGIMPILLVWVLRLWHLAVNGRMSEDPVLFALKDRLSLALGLAVIFIMLVAWF